MFTGRRSKKRKTRSCCSGIELASAFHVLQKFRDTIKAEDLFDPNDSNLQQNLQSVERDVEVDEDALAKPDGILQWMDSKIKSATKVGPWLLVSYR
jgi:hypothetical protein